MPPKPANLKLPGLSHADSEISAGAVDSPRQTRSGRIIPPTPQARRTTRARPLLTSLTSATNQPPPPHLSSNFAPENTQNSQTAEHSNTDGDVSAGPTAALPASSALQAPPSPGTGSSRQARRTTRARPLLASLTSAADQPPPSYPLSNFAPANAQDSQTPGLSNFDSDTTAEPAAALPASSTAQAPPSHSTGSSSRTRDSSFSRSRVEHPVTRSEEHVAPSHKGKEPASNVGAGTPEALEAESISAPEESSLAPHAGSYAAAESSTAPQAGSSMTGAAESSSAPQAGSPQAPQAGSFVTGAAESSSAPQAGSSQAPSTRQRDITPIGGIRWPEIEAYLETRSGSPPPRVVCLFCQEELIIDGLQAPTSEKSERVKILPCGHVFGEKCIQSWVDQHTYIDEVDGPTSATCPICRRSASSGRELPPAASLSDVFQETPRGRQMGREPPERVLSRRHRPDTSVSTPRPPSQRARHQSPSGDLVMEDAEEVQPNPQPDPPPNPQPDLRLNPHPQRQHGCKYIWIKDPDLSNADGQPVEREALLLGGLAMRGRMAVELPSLNLDFPSCPRRFAFKTKDYKITWRALSPLQRRDVDRLKAIAKHERERVQGYWMPEVTGIISTPQYSTEAQSRHDTLRLRLPTQSPEGVEWHEEWHSKSDSFAAFGDLTLGMEDYWVRSGQRKQAQPRKPLHREYLQHFGVQHGGEAHLAELDIFNTASMERLQSMTAQLERDRLEAQRSDRHPERHSSRD